MKSLAFRALAQREEVTHDLHILEKVRVWEVPVSCFAEECGYSAQCMVTLKLRARKEAAKGIMVYSPAALQETETNLVEETSVSKLV